MYRNSQKTITPLLYWSKLTINGHTKETLGAVNDTCTNLISESPLRPGVEVTRLGLPRGFRGVLSSLLSTLGRLGVVWNEKQHVSTQYFIDVFLRLFCLRIYGTCDGERPVSFCDVRFPSTNPKLALPWLVFKAKKIKREKQCMWHVNKNRRRCNNKKKKHSTIPVCLLCFIVSKYSFIFFSTNVGSFSKKTTHSFSVIVTRCALGDEDHKTFTLGFSCSEMSIVKTQR